jgi:hypothetical protein
MSLPRLQEPIIHRQINIDDRHIGHRRRPAALTHGVGHGVAAQQLVTAEQEPQRLVDRGLALPRRQQEDLQVLLDRPAGTLPLQGVVRHPKAAGGEHRSAVPVFLERPRLAHQPVDHVAVLDAVLAPAPKPRQLVHPTGPVPDLQSFGPDVDLDPLADQLARYRVDVPADVDRAPRGDPHLDPPAHLQPPGWQRRQDGLLLGDPLAPVRVPPGHDLAEECLVRAACGELATPPQQEGLVDRLLEPVVTLLDVPVLVGLPRPDRLGFQAVMDQQRLVPPGEHLGVGVGLDRGTEAVGAVLPGNPSQFPQRVLQPLAQALPALREADRAGLPVGVGQHEVVDQVVERYARNRDAQLGHVGEVRGAEPPRFVGLREEHLLGWPFEGPPQFDPPLEGPQLPVGVAAREAALQVQKEGLGLEAGVEPERLQEFGPDVLERVLPGPPGVGDAPLAGESVRVAVLACRLLVDARLVRGVGQGVFGLEQLPQPPELAIGEHPSAPSSVEPKRDSLPGLRGREF